MANYTINTAGSTTCNYPSTINEGDVLTFNVTNTATNTKYKGTMLTYTFPCDCTAEILAAGAKGGNGAGGTSAAGGRGAIVAGTISFKTGDQLLMCVGQAGTNWSGSSSSADDGTTGAGGGGTFVTRKVNSSSYRYTASGTGNNWYVEPLVIGAGGNGGGDWLYEGHVTVHASSNQGNDNNAVYDDNYNGGGFSKCASTSYSAECGRSFLTGAQGATSAYNRSGSSVAGFGGGGGNEDDNDYGGGGGGYSGGYPGTAATSFVITSASNISRKSGSSQGNNGEGYVKITFKTIVPAVEFPPTEVVMQAGFDAKVKVSDTWKDGEKGYVKVNNEWKEISKMYTKVNNNWVLTGEEKKFLVYTLLYQGYLNDKTMIGGYNGTATYSAYTAGTGVTLSVAAKPSYGTAYPAAVGNFVNKVTNKIKTITFDYQRTTGSTSFDIGVYVSTTAQTGRLNSTTASGLIKAVQTVNSNSGTITINLEEAFGDDLATYTNHYLGLYLYQSDGTATTVVIKDMTYAEQDMSTEDNTGGNESGGQTPPPSGGTSAKDPIYLIQNGDPNNSTIYGTIGVDMNYIYLDFSPVYIYDDSILGVSMGNTMTGYAYTTFNKKVDLSDIKEIQVKLYPYHNYDRTNVDKFGLVAMNTNSYSGGTTLPSGSTVLGEKTLNFSSNNQLTVTIPVTNSNLSGSYYLGLMYYNANGSVENEVEGVVITEVKVIYKDGTSSGGSGGGTTGNTVIVQNGKYVNTTTYGTFGTGESDNGYSYIKYEGNSSNGLSLKAYGTYNASSYVVSSLTKPINMSSYSSIKLEADISPFSINYGNSYLYLIIYDYAYSFEESDSSAYYIYSDCVTYDDFRIQSSTSSATITLDVSNITGNKYIALALSSAASTNQYSNTGSTAYIKTLELVPSNSGSGGNTGGGTNIGSPTIFSEGVDNYGITNINNWNKGISNFGISTGSIWFEVTFLSGQDYNGYYSYNVFKVPIDVTDYTSLEISYMLQENMWANTDLEFGLQTSTSTTAGTIAYVSPETYYKDTSVVTLSINTSRLSGNHYFVIGGQRSIDIVIYEIRLVNSSGGVTPRDDI